MHALVQNWWVVLLRGIAALLFGVVVALYPAASLIGLLVAFGVYAFVAGSFAIGAGIVADPVRRWDVVAEGIIGVLAGIATFSRPGLTGLALFALIAAFALVTGALQVIEAVRLRREVKGVGWLAASGAVSIVFGAMMIALPRAGVMALAWLVAIYGITLGVTMVALSLRLKQVHDGLPTRLVPTMRSPHPV
jgi:uncharacterized membrane protein HdeD (DUF308 family)